MLNPYMFWREFGEKIHRMRCLLALFLFPQVLWAQEAWRDPFIVYQEAQISAARGDYPAARTALEELLAKQVTPPGFYVLYGIVLFASKDFIAAQVAFGEALAENPNDAQAHFYTGLIYLQQNKKKEARESFQKAQNNLAIEDELRPSVDKLLEGLAEEPEKPPRLHALASFSTQADSNAQLTPEEAASDAAGARFLFQAAGSFAQPITKNFSIEAAGGGLLSLPFINAEVLKELDPSVVFTSLSFEVKAKNVLGGASFSGKLYGLEEFQTLFMQEGSALFLAQVGGKNNVRAVYRATLSNFILSEEAEGTSFDQDCLQQEATFTFRSEWGPLASILYNQAEADGNSFDRRGATMQVGFEKAIKRSEFRASLDGGVVQFPNGDTPRRDLRASFAAQASTSIKGVSFSLAYQGVLSESSDEDFSYVRHLVTLGTRWQR
jgi:tetratricopeptide (TPR) repeat protein